jgi:hypothetical protein
MDDNIDKTVLIIHSIKKWMSFIVLILMMIIVIIAIVELGIILIGLALIIIALGGCYYLIKSSYRINKKG